MHDEDTWIGGALQPVPLKVRAAIAPIISDHDLILVGVEQGREGHRTILWIFVDTEEGATIQDCAKVTPEISAVLDVEDPVPDSYELRVSTPGLDRPLMRAADFDRFAGEEVQLTLLTPLRGRRKYTGINRGVKDDSVTVECTDGAHDVPLNFVQKARLKYSVTFGKKRP
ncbi:MAG: ribosome maturation factor RimP [Myxococcota bacterium]|nr:ribosome maturation factor RimP [Myxococcota bacterium]